MLLDVWEWFLLINDGIDLVLSNLASGTYPIPFSFLLVVIFFGLVSFFAWKSTDIPDLPPAPRPPYVIQIVAGPAATGTNRQTISDVRLLSGGFFDGHELLNRYRNLARNQATNTDRNPQAGTSSGEAGVNVEVRRFNAPTANTTRGIPGRSFLLSLFGRPDALIRQRPAGIANALRAQLTSTPNVVVYHRVNVYHHHIHSHPATPGSSNNIQPQNSSPNQQQAESESLSSQQGPGISSPSGSDSVPQDQSSPSPETATTTPESESSSTPEASPNQLGCSDPASPSDGVIHDQINDAFDSSGVSSEDVDPDLDSILSLSAPNSAVQFVENLDSNPTASTSGVEKSMPAESSSTRSGDGEGNLSQQKPSSTSSTSTSSSTVGGGAGAVEDVRFIIKFLNDTQMDVTSHLGEKIVDFKRRHFATEMSENKTVRLIFNGRVLDNDTKTLREFGIFDQCVVHCLIVNRQQHQDQSRSSNASASGRGNNGGGDPMQENMRRVGGLPEPGMFFIAFIGIFLIFLWFICLHFGQHLFTQSAVVSLTVLTAIFLIGIVACYLPLPVN